MLLLIINSPMAHHLNYLSFIDSSSSYHRFHVPKFSYRRELFTKFFSFWYLSKPLNMKRFQLATNHAISEPGRFKTNWILKYQRLWPTVENPVVNHRNWVYAEALHFPFTKIALPGTFWSASDEPSYTTVKKLIAGVSCLLLDLQRAPAQVLLCSLQAG